MADTYTMQKVIFIIACIFGLICCSALIIVGIFSVIEISEDETWKINWKDEGSTKDKWRDHDPEQVGFPLAIFSLFIVFSAVLGWYANFVLLFFKRFYLLRKMFGFLAILEGHALFLMVMGVLELGLLVNSGILVGSFCICVGFCFLILAFILRAWVGSTASRGEYRLFRAGKT